MRIRFQPIRAQKVMTSRTPPSIFIRFFLSDAAAGGAILKEEKYSVKRWKGYKRQDVVPRRLPGEWVRDRFWPLRAVAGGCVRGTRVVSCPLACGANRLTVCFVPQWSSSFPWISATGSRKWGRWTCRFRVGSAHRVRLGGTGSEPGSRAGAESTRLIKDSI